MPDFRHLHIVPEALGSATFRADYGIKYAYLSGAMYKGIASRQLVVAMGKAGLMGYLGTGGLDLQEIEAGIRYIQNHLPNGKPYGMNLLSEAGRPEHEAKLVELYLRYGIRYVEAAAFIQISPSLIRYRLTGARRTSANQLHVPNHVLAKVSRPEVAEAFMRPPAPRMVAKLEQQGLLRAEEAALAHLIPMASDICVEADSAGHTDQGVAYALMPAMLKLRDAIVREQHYTSGIRIGAAGGIGTPEAAAAAFVLGADFILTGSINQCTVEAGTSDEVKNILQTMDIQDTTYAPAGDMFELGAKVQVLKKGLFFPARANKLYELYMRHDSLDDIDPQTRHQIQNKYFKQSFEDVWAETCAYYRRAGPFMLDAAEVNPKQKMALVFRWYFILSTRLAMRGDTERKVDYQIHCGPALGAFNQWVKGTELEDWRKRHAPDIGERIMKSSAQLLGDCFAQLVDSQRQSGSALTRA
jgi:trans-AT polyketide synthase/acyltransferase/oxidoreductase domain-containing protein